MCIKKYLIVLRPIFDTTYKRKKCQNIHASSTSRIDPILKKWNFFRYERENEIKGEILVWTTS